MRKDKTVKFRLTSELLEQITHKAKGKGLTNTQVITEAITEYLNFVPTSIESVPTKNNIKSNLYPQKDVKRNNVPTNTKGLTIAQILANKRQRK